MKCIFWGTLFDPESSNELLKQSKVGLQNAANMYQWGFINGLQQNGVEPIEIISALPVGSYPKYNKIFYYEKNFDTRNNVTINQTPFLNFFVLRELCREFFFYKWTKHKIDSSEDEIVLFVYSLYLPFLLNIKRLKKIYGQKLRICLIVPDLPGKYGIMRSPLTFAGLWDRLTSKLILKLSRWADNYVLLTMQMKDVLKISKPFCVIEGFVSNENTLELTISKNESEKVILYAGSFNPEFGIEDLLQSFVEIPDENYRLWLCGPPNEASIINDYSLVDSRIKYWGYLTKSELNVLQAKCDVLVNPRKNVGNFVKFSFPSKTMDYIASGKPVIMYRLDGVPEEYNKCVYFVATTLKETLINILSKPRQELLMTSNCAKEWILNEKNSAKQVKKALELF